MALDAKWIKLDIGGYGVELRQRMDPERAVGKVALAKTRSGKKEYVRLVEATDDGWQFRVRRMQ